MVTWSLVTICPRYTYVLTSSIFASFIFRCIAFADLEIFNVVRWWAIPLHLPVLLSQFVCTCWQLVGFLTFVSASYWNGSFMNHLRSCVTPRVKIAWCKRCKSSQDVNLEFSPAMLQLTSIYPMQTIGVQFLRVFVAANTLFFALREVNLTITFFMLLWISK